MSAPNMSHIVERIQSIKNHDITTILGCEALTAQVTATLHFGSPGLVDADARWGRRRNPFGVISFDVLNYLNDECIDIVRSGGGPNAALHWERSTPGQWIAPDVNDRILLNPNNPGNPPPENDETMIVLKEIRDNTFRTVELLEKAARRFGIE